jgi:hypothetical protein
MAILVHHAKAPIPRLPERLALLQPVIDLLMAKDPEDRPANASDAARLIDGALKAMPPPASAAAARAPAASEKPTPAAT